MCLLPNVTTCSQLILMLLSTLTVRPVLGVSGGAFASCVEVADAFRLPDVTPHSQANRVLILALICLQPNVITHRSRMPVVITCSLSVSGHKLVLLCLQPNVTTYSQLILIFLILLTVRRALGVSLGVIASFVGAADVFLLPDVIPHSMAN